MTEYSEMAKELEKVRKAARCTRRELVRNAFRLYFVHRYGAVKPTRRELRGLRRGRAEIARGDYLTNDELRDALATARRPTRQRVNPFLSWKFPRPVG